MSYVKALVFLLALSGCSDRAQVGVDGSTTVDSAVDLRQDIQRAPDKAPDVTIADATRCPKASAWSFVTSFPPGQDTVEQEGAVTYHGAITDPLAMNPAFKYEIRLEADNGRELVLQYYLPGGRRLPLDEGSTYTVTVRRRWMFEGYAEGLIIERETPGPFSLVFAGDTGYGGRAIDYDDPQIAPLMIEQVAGDDCPVSDACGDGAYVDQLRFIATTGAGISEALLAQGSSGSVTIMGMSFAVVNVRAYHVATPCPDEIDQFASWVAILE